MNVLGCLLVGLILTSTYHTMTEEEIKKEYSSINASLGGHKRYLSKIANNVATYVDAETLAGEKVIEAKQLQDNIESRLVLIQGLFDELLSNPNLVEEDIDNFDSYMSSINKKLASLKFKIGKSNAQSVKLGSPISQNPVGPCDSAVKYPEIKLPSFSGGVNGVRDFRPFYQIFKALVEDKDGIPEIYKVQYLRECLPEGSEARQLINHIPPTAENYSLHIATLMSRYENNSGEANRLRRVLMQVGSWQVCNSIESQRKLLDHVRQNMALLRQIEEIEVEDMRCLALDLLAIIPERLRYEVARLRKEERTVDTILDMVEENIKSKLEVRSFLDPAKKQSDVGKRNQQPTRQYTHLYHTSNQSRGQKDTGSDRPCVYCGDTGHTPHKCTKKSKDERASMIAKGRRCWNCLSDRHQVRDCDVPTRCQCSSKGKHSPSLCGVKPPWRLKGRAYVTGEIFSTKQNIVGAGMTSTGVDSVPYLSTIEIDLPTKCGRSQKIRFLLDNAATHSYGTESSIDQLPVADSGKEVDITVSTFSGLRQISARMVELKLTSEVSISLVVTDSICEPLHGHNLSESCIEELAGYQLADPSCVKEELLPIDVLVGVDNYWKLVTDQVVRLRSGLVLMSTLFGWVLSGEVSSRRSMIHNGTYLAHTLLINDSWRDSRLFGLSAQDNWYHSYFHTLCSHESSSAGLDVDFIGPHSHSFGSPVDSSSDSDLEEVRCDLGKFWDLDTLGIKPDREISPILEDFQHTLSQDTVSGRYTASLPQKRNIINLPSNFGSSLRRLDSLMAKFKRPGNEDFARKYCAIIKDQLEQGIIEKVSLPDDERQRLEKYVSLSCGEFYIPHHGVEKKGKVRVVYDGSSSAYKGALSLNQCLLVGPSLMNLLAEVLLAFRLHSVVLLADIQKAFLQVGVTESDRDLLRFLWYGEDGTLEVYRFTRVPFGTGPSPFLLNATLKHHFEKVVKDQSLLSLLFRSLYVDDVLTGGETSDFVLQLREELTRILGQAAMNLHGWDSNSAEVREVMGVEDQPDDKLLLGVCWNRKKDDMGINLEKILSHSKGASSKRELLRGTSRLFDPHGIYSPVVLVPKLMFQKICSRKFGWDDPLPEGIDKEWTEWRDQLVLLERVRVQRHVLLPKYDRLELHGFSDASQSAYAAVVYIKSSSGKETASNLIMCKSRVAPQKKLSIPRLELMGALLLARLMAAVVAYLKHLKIDSIVYYTDSMNVLYWIRTEHRMWAVFVACRIKEINSLSNFADWKYVRTDLNPADLATRGLKPSELLDNKLWFNGPDFVVSGRSDPEVDSSRPTAACLGESKKAVLVVGSVPTGMSTFIKCEDFSSVHKLLSRTVLLLKFVFWLAQKYLKDSGDKFKFSTPELYGQARQLWIKSVQLETYSTEIRFCKNNPVKVPVGMKVPGSLLRQLDLFLDSQGILRTRTRLRDAVVSDSVKYPVLLPKDHHFTGLLIKDTHLRLYHAGVRQVMSSLRGIYWIPHCRRTVAKFVRSCVKCRRVTAGFYPVPDPPPLPDFRVAKVDAFDHIGVDHCGPLYVKEGKKELKCYVLIITCAVTRAVHLELVADMSVQEFMLGFRKFVGRRGLPSFILSDNSLTFKCASSELTSILNDPKFQKYLNGRNIRWQRYLEYSPWWGGWIEKLNNVFKSALHKVIGGACISFRELSTLLTEVEAIINSRPISYVYDSADEGQAITPSILLCGKDLTQLPPNMFDYKFERKLPQTCKLRLKYLEKIKTYFWTRWTREYLAELTVMHATTRKGREVRMPKVNDIVLVKEGGDTVKVPRHLWRVGRILSVHEGRDGKVRSVDVSLAQQEEGKPALLRHKSPRHLVPLECDEADD